METKNNTQFPDILDQIDGSVVIGKLGRYRLELPLPLIKTGKNNWRQRNISIYEHPTDSNRVISVGITFDGKTRIICDDSKADWTRELSQPGSFETN